VYFEVREPLISFGEQRRKRGAEVEMGEKEGRSWWYRRERGEKKDIQTCIAGPGGEVPSPTGGRSLTSREEEIKKARLGVPDKKKK